MRMRILRIQTKVKFDAAHHLPGHKGKCGSLHGHTWTVQIEVDGPVNKETGMVVDFGELKKKVEQFDHGNLNDYIENPTAENIALRIQGDILEYIEKHTLQPPKYAVKIAVWESPDSCAITEGD